MVEANVDYHIVGYFGSIEYFNILQTKKKKPKKPTIKLFYFGCSVKKTVKVGHKRVKI